MDRTTETPGIVSILGWLGVIPFAGLALYAALGVPPGRSAMLEALIAYGAIILSFLGGVAWGLVLAPQADRARVVPVDLAVGVSASIVGWAATLVPHFAGLLMLIAAFVAMLGYDIYNTRRGVAPQWFPMVRIRLTSAVVAALLVATPFA